MDIKKLAEDNEKLVSKFGAKPISRLKDLPGFYTFNKNLIYSHRDFDKYFSEIKKNKKCAIVSGFNPSGTLHIGHKPFIDTLLFFQKEYKIPLFIPLSDDESYVTNKVKTQEEALENAKNLAVQLIAYGFNPKRTYFIIDQIYTNIYNFAIKLCRKLTLSEVRATYGYKNEDNPGMFFYPSIQSAHILFPNIYDKTENILVPIGPDEDSHIRISRDLAARFGYKRPAILHLSFLPGLDGEKMSKSRNNAIFLKESPEIIRKKVNKALSGGQETIEEHRKKGGNPEQDVACLYLTKLFLNEKESKELIQNYKSGKLLSKDVKDLLSEKMIEFTQNFQNNIKKVKKELVEKCILKNE